MPQQPIWAKNTHAGQPVPLAWVRLLAAHAELTGPMDAKLRASHDLTINDYEVLLWLSWAPQGRLRRVELSQAVHLTQGGVTRLLSGLERAGLVQSAKDSTDRRVVHAQLTDLGRDRLAAAAQTHVADISTEFTDRFSPAELATLAQLLGRLTTRTATPASERVSSSPGGAPPHKSSTRRPKS